MADNFLTSVESLFKGMDKLITTKTVVGEPVKVDGAVIIPLIDVSCGMASGSFSRNAENSGGGGMGARMSPTAVLIIQNGVTKVINIKNQDAVSKLMDIVPDFVNRISAADKISPAAGLKAKDIAESGKEIHENM